LRKTLENSTTVTVTAVVEAQTLGHYTIIARLGEGGMGVVYKARDTRLDRFVALKTLNSRHAGNELGKRRFAQEARAASALNHPNIVTIHDIDAAGGVDYIAMEFIEGASLRTMASALDDPAAIVPILRQVAEGLAVAHAGGIVHRDIKPDNVMVRNDGYVKILDFGIARLARSVAPEDETAADMTGPGVTLGTVRYMSPEQGRGLLAESPSDIFSLGILAYELLTGRHPFASGNHLDTLQAIMQAHPTPPSRLKPTIPAELDDLIGRMLAKQPVMRPSASDVRTSLSALGGHRPAVPEVRTSHPRNSVGRSEETQRLTACFETIDATHLRILCIAGEPGIGKTTLVEEFIADVRSASGAAWLGRGRCSERLSGADAFLPILESLDSLVRGEGGDQAARLLKTFAPAWFIQIAPLAGDATMESLAHDAKSASTERMKREILTFFEQMGRIRPVILFFDDVHWSDISTCDLLSYLGSKSESLRLMIIATYRPAEMLASKHPFHQVKLHLEGRGISHDIRLRFLSEEDVERYVANRFAPNDFPVELIRFIHQRTEGNPLFMADILRYLRDRRIVTPSKNGWSLAQPIEQIAREVPDSIRSMIQVQIDRFTEGDRKLMVAAAIEGVEFDSAVVAKTLALDPIEVEESLQQIEQVHGFIRLVGEQEYPDRTLTVRYRFVHVFYQNSLYGSLTPSRRAAMSLSVGRAMLGFGADRIRSNATTLAFLFEAGRDFTQAATFFNAAARGAARVFAYPEALQLSERGLLAAASLPEGMERARIELGLSFSLGVAQMATKGYAALEVEQTYIRTRDLCLKLSEHRRLFPVLWGLWTYYLIGADLPKAAAIAKEMLERWEAAGDPVARIEALHAQGTTLGYMGSVTEGREFLQEALDRYRANPYPFYASVYVLDPAVSCLAMLARLEVGLGNVDRALSYVRDASELSARLNHPQSLAYASCFTGMIQFFRQDYAGSLVALDRALQLSKEHGLPQIREWCRIFHGWAQFKSGAVKEGIQDMRRSIDGQARIRSMLERPHCLAMLAEALGESGEIEEALRILDEGLREMARSSERIDEPDLRRVRGLILAQDITRAAEAAKEFELAVKLARSRSQRLYEYRALRDWHRFAPSAAEASRLAAEIRQLRAGMGEEISAPVFSED
jgi:tRNA A-37 threonylcarbamoyl transferase component Bud32/predicted ATPase